MPTDRPRLIKFKRQRSNPPLAINLIGGKIIIPQLLDDEEFQGFLSNRVREVAKLPSPSSQKQEKIMAETLKDKEAFLNSDAGKSILNDLNN